MMKAKKTFVYFFLFFCSCSGDYQPKKNSNIPQKAMWYGGSDGGCWIIIDSIVGDEVFDVRIFDDFTGEILDSGRYKVCNFCRLNADSIKYFISCYDGEKIFLVTKVDNDPCYLHKIP